ncbi:MAG: histidine kinase [Bacteroidota bacterium]|nr:histidine kinase [Bacteroidota bacterium]
MMKTKLPIKNLAGVYFYTAIISCLVIFLYIFLDAKVGDLNRALIYSLVSFLVTTLTGIVNLGMILFLEERFDMHSRIFNWLRIVLGSILGFFVCTITIILFVHYDKWVYYMFNINGTKIIVFILIMLINALFIILQNYIILQNDKANTDLEISRLKTVNAEAANQLLRQQIHPHFLFNALNTLKSLYKREPQTAEEYLVHLSDFLRASISTNNIKVIRLKDELKLCLDYLNMQKIRFGNALVYSIEISREKQENGFVPSFSIQPLLENAIKHNELTGESPLNITVKQEKEWIKVTNNLNRKTSTENSTGSGLANLSERYRLLSDNDLIIEENEKTFSVSIKILEDEHHNHRR